MKILRVIPSMNPAVGGPCQGIRNAIPALSKLQVENEVVSMDSPDSPYLGGDPFKIHAIGKASGPWSYNKDLIPWLVAHFQHYDAVVIHGLWQYHSYATIKALNIYKKSNTGRNQPKIFAMPHGMLDPWFQKAKGRKLKAIRNWFFWKLVEGRVLNQVDGVLFTCEVELELAKGTFTPYKPKREINVSYGIPAPPSFAASMREAFSKKCPQPQSEPYFIFLSRINYKKGVDILIDAYDTIVQEAEAKGILIPNLVIAGPELETEFGQMIKAKVSNNPRLSHRVCFPGMLTGEAKWGAFYGSEAFILPSHQENFGIAVAEALACGVPVLISDQVNIWTEIKAGNAGLIENDNYEGVLNLFRNWLQLEHTQKTAMRSNAKMVYESNFAVEPAAAKFLKGISIEPAS